jgi:hypothetical protein
MRKFVHILISSLFSITSLGINISNTLLPNPKSHDLSADNSLHGLFSGENVIYLPLVSKPVQFVPRVNAPYFEDNILFSQSAVFWFGQVTPAMNYADVRVGYNDAMVQVSVHIFDRQLWYNRFPTPSTLTNWDAVSLYLNLDGAVGSMPTPNSYRFIVQLNNCSSPWDPYQTALQGNGSGWVSVPANFTTGSCWRGQGLNDETKEARGWHAVFKIPFASLGLSGPPASGSAWRMGVSIHDRDDGAGTPIPDQRWPQEMDSNQPKTWSELHFGMPTFEPPDTSVSEMITIRHGLNGAVVVDGEVGGHTICGQAYWPDEFFTGWGQANYAGYEQFNVQNQWDVADFPCFSKYYIAFPLGSLPVGKIVISATLTLHKTGNAGQGKDPPPGPSLIQVLTVKDSWQEETLTWNNAPLPMENVAAAWVEPHEAGEVSWPGVPYDWNISRAVSEAYARGEPLRLALYTADTQQNSGKYFVASDIGEWNAEGRPTLEVVLGNP